MPALHPRVVSVTVTYNPDSGRLAEQLARLSGQVDEMLVVDNASDLPMRPHVEAHRNARLMELQSNVGVAGGFNIGVRAARESGADFVLLLDHDSIPTEGMVGALLAGYSHAAATGVPVAAVGPRVNDLRDRRDYPFIRLGWLRNAHLRCGDVDGVIACDFLISSGTLIALENWDRVGELDERLFIDSVDLEWCCRARSRGLALYGVCAAQLDHWLGDERRDVLHLSLVVHSPHRLYYMTRNRFLLYQRAYMPLRWKVKDMLRFIGKSAATLLLIHPRGEYLRMTLRGVHDAVRRRPGPLLLDP